jgi:hypothetical protein
MITPDHTNKHIYGITKYYLGQFPLSYDPAENYQQTILDTQIKMLLTELHKLKTK